MVPKRIWLSYNKKLSSVQTQELEFVDDLAEAARNKFLPYLRHFATSDITLHVDEHAEALATVSALTEIAAQLSPCGISKTPLIVKVTLDVAPETPLIAKGISAIIWLSFKGNLVRVETKGLLLVDQLVKAARNKLSYLCDFKSLDADGMEAHLLTIRGVFKMLLGPLQKSRHNYPLAASQRLLL
ncbi:hypothetical protein PGT21_016822 [Puccinia graminis f. sp. tritici]|uniref:Uncharacterized protein n=1 Tax=Puccinia graminis f. sp. tritici TaxID=56615 RepID=A0A5B0MF28_PUCGR|nr:hypothetical protein PGT21_016822 [Puccinia graminis f. sp. tritici]